MSIRQLFAYNLRKLCSAKRSHAQVARDLGLNRQQFNNYVTGRNLPNERIIDNMCAYFGVEVSYMFQKYNIDELTKSNFLEENHVKFVRRFISNERNIGKSNISGGLYNIYFEIPSEPELLVCSLLAVKREGNLTTFRRVTRLKDAAGITIPGGKGFHSGVIVNRFKRIFLIGLDSIYGGSPSMLIASPKPNLSTLYEGRADVATPSEFQSVKFCIVPMHKKIKLKDALKTVKLQYKNELSTSNSNIFKYFSH